MVLDIRTLDTPDPAGGPDRHPAGGINHGHHLREEPIATGAQDAGVKQAVGTQGVPAIIRCPLHLTHGPNYLGFIRFPGGRQRRRTGSTAKRSRRKSFTSGMETLPSSCQARTSASKRFPFPSSCTIVPRRGQTRTIQNAMDATGSRHRPVPAGSGLTQIFRAPVSRGWVFG